MSLNHTSCRRCRLSHGSLLASSAARCSKPKIVCQANAAQASWDLHLTCRWFRQVCTILRQKTATHDLNTAGIVRESCASPFRRSTWLSLCLIPNVSTVFDDFDNPRDYSSILWLFLCNVRQVQVNGSRDICILTSTHCHVIDCAPACKNVEIIAVHCAS